MQTTPKNSDRPLAALFTYRKASQGPAGVKSGLQEHKQPRNAQNGIRRSSSIASSPMMIVDCEEPQLPMPICNPESRNHHEHDKITLRELLTRRPRKIDGKPAYIIGKAAHLGSNISENKGGTMFGTGTGTGIGIGIGGAACSLTITKTASGHERDQLIHRNRLCN